MQSGRNPAESTGAVAGTSRSAGEVRPWDTRLGQVRRLEPLGIAQAARLRTGGPEALPPSPGTSRMVSPWQTAPVESRRLLLNRSQRVVIVVGLGVGFGFLGQWATTQGQGFGWVAYAPLTNNTFVPGGLHPWVRLLIWLGLVVVWMVASVALLRTTGKDEGD